MFTKQLLKEKYPKSYELLLKFIGEQLRNVQKLGIPPDTELPEIQKKFIESTVDGLILGNPRILYDFFSEFDIEVLIGYSNNFIYTIYNNSNYYTNKNFYTKRIEAEFVAFEEAFKILEDKNA